MSYISRLFASSVKLHDEQPVWLLVLLAVYAVLELSFNHHLMQVSAAAVPDLDAIKDLEFWARVISGLGLSMWMVRFLLGRGLAPVVALVLSMSVGVTVMWHVQRWLVDAIVTSASEQDKQMSLYAKQLAPGLLAGQVQVRGSPLLQPELISADNGTVWQALLPAVMLGLKPDELRPIELQSLMAPGALSQDCLADAYRSAVIVPIALGVSLMFGLANLCLLVSLIVRRFSPGRWTAALWLQPVLFLVFWLSTLAWTWYPTVNELRSAGYREVARPALRDAQPVLAPFVEWTLQAQPAWQEPTRWLHENLLGRYGFRKPALMPGL